MSWPELAALFRLGVEPLELVVRGTAIYWFLFLLFRFVLRRDSGSIAIADILLLVLIADASQNALAGGYTSISEGIVLVATIAGWTYLLDWMAFRLAWVRRLLEAPPLRLVRNGHFIRENLRREMLTVDDLKSKLREQGIDDVAKVKSAFMEGNGEISVIRADDQAPSGGRSSNSTLP